MAGHLAARAATRCIATLIALAKLAFVAKPAIRAGGR